MCPLSPVVLDVVYDEAVRAGLDGGHPDAAAIEAALGAQTIQPAPGGHTGRHLPDGRRGGDRRVEGLGELGRALGLDAWATHDLLASEGVAVAQGNREETAQALDDALGGAASARR